MNVRDMFDLTGSKAILTGAAGGIGRELAAALAERGADVALVDINEQGLSKVADDVSRRGKNPLICKTDVTSSSNVEKMVDKVIAEWGTIDILVNCAGISHHTPAENLTEDDWDRVLDVNLKSVFLCCQAVGRTMIANRRGKIINIASISAHIINRPIRQSHYHASKAGVVALTRSLGAEWAEYNINVNCISPGYIDTEMTRKIIQYRDQWKALTPLGRVGRPSEISGAVIYLASDASTFMTGQELIVDGGYTLW